ncbi:putative disease resistance RPP13-like protein 3 [Dioscorea cayenensis subsp. rotundata]|uniref:Disease resistance RPP13-like protein 3 n=1 Tax=Dioscorea cayennensis subsp. rotundata TaxID=55577 RepID=A0AB40BTV0_DIOCR|nr:putative disease resistance RPP13-like protein 3 [Dioscorea cayenensis subsp. rotundata]
METVVSFAVTKLTDLLAQEVGLPQGVDDELRSFLDLLYNKDDDERAKLWVNQVRDLAHDAKDIIDDYIFRMHQQTSTSSYLSFLRTFVVLPSKLAILHDFANNIGKVKGRAQEIYANRIYTFANQSIGAGTSSDPLTSTEARLPLMSRRQSAVVEEVDVLGFHEHFRALVRMLMGDDGHQRRAVVSITGMGGLGKTTLAKKIFSDPDIRRHFTYQAWIWVSQDYRAREGAVNSFLQRKKYLVILDDIWSKGAWDSIKEVLPDMMNRSRVLLTTRNQDVALYADRQSPPYDLKFLGEEDSWELFCKKAIPTKWSKDCPPQLESIGREMVAKCCGLPLAIIVLGRLVLTKRQSVEEWRKLLKSANWHLRQGEEQIPEILALSYHHLPYYIKPFFLYFKGFIQPRDQETMEDVAEDYLEELVNWGLIQVVVRHHHGGIKICQIHELLHDLSISLGQGMNFIHIPNNDNQRKILHKPRRLVLHHDDKNASCIARLKSSNFTSRLRTITVMDMEKRTSKMEKFFHNMKLLRVINLQATGIKSLPDDIGKLIHLRYLGLRYIDLRALPSSIGRLTNLQTLDIKNSIHISELPSQKATVSCREIIQNKFPAQHLIGTERKITNVGHSSSNNGMHGDFGIRRDRRILGRFIWVVFNAIGGWRAAHCQRHRSRHVSGVRRCLGAQCLLSPDRLQIARSCEQHEQRHHHTPELGHAGEKLEATAELRFRVIFSTRDKNRINRVHALISVMRDLGAGPWLQNGLQKMTNLSKLGVHDVTSTYKQAFLDCLGKLDDLTKLAWKTAEDSTIPSSIFSAGQHNNNLQVIYLRGPLEGLPNDNCMPTNLTKLTLESTRLQEDPLLMLGKLGNLQVLRLRYDAFVGREMVCSEKGFPQLKVLELNSLLELKLWRIEDESMPSLENWK